MATTYAGVTIKVLVPEGTRPERRREKQIQRRIIPYANKEDIQDPGFGNYELTIPVLIENDTGIATLEAARGTTTRTLSDYFGTTYSNVLLVDVKDQRRLNNSANWFATLTLVFT